MHIKIGIREIYIIDKTLMHMLDYHLFSIFYIHMRFVSCALSDVGLLTFEAVVPVKHIFGSACMMYDYISYFCLFSLVKYSAIIISCSNCNCIGKKNLF